MNLRFEAWSSSLRRADATSVESRRFFNNRIAPGPAGQPDGKQYPVAGLNQTNVNTIALTIVYLYTVEFTQYVNGIPVSKGKRTVSKDGKTMMIETKGTNAQGQSTSSSVLWEKEK